MNQIILFREPRKCLICPCTFFNSKDFQLHAQTHWKPTRNGNGEFMPSEADPHLTSMLQTVGKMVKLGYRYSLFANRKMIFREKI